MIPTFLLAAATGVAPVPPPVEQEFANCESPTYASDQLVCGDEALRALDAEMRSLLPMTPTATLKPFESQGDWFRRSRTCAFRSDQAVCLSGAYRERIMVLKAAHAFTGGGDTWQPFLCRRKKVTINVAPAGDGVYAVRFGDGVFLAVSGESLNGWTPWLRWSQPKPNSLSIDGASGLKLACIYPSI